ncbi:MAG: exo-alpha-sialidase [Pseudomonadales bacterium]|nr:exo-alpha-sialidase [Pseudomonadales bacterium]
MSQLSLRSSVVAVAAALLVSGSLSAYGAGTLVSASDHKAQSPEIALGPDGAINMVWIDEDPAPERHDTGGHGHSHVATTNLFFARSTDDGKSYSEPLRINHKDGEVWGFSVSKPRVAVGANGTIHIFYPANAVNPITGKPVAVAMYTRSTDGGKTFAEPQQVNTNATSDASAIVHGGISHGHVFGTLAVDSKGSVYTLWIDTRDMAKEGDNGKMFMAISRDDGKTFAKDAELFPADVCPCCQLTAYVDEDDRLFIGSRQVADGYRDSTITVSTDGGRTFSPRQRIVGKRWAIEGCPLKPTTVAARGDDIYAAYYTGAEDPQGVYFVHSTDGGKTYTAPMLVHPGAKVSDAPVLTLAGNTLYLFWHAKVGDGPRRLFARASTDRGSNFSEPVELPATEGAAQLPAVVGRADGSVRVAWQQGSEVRAMQWSATPARVATAGH